MPSALHSQCSQQERHLPVGIQPLASLVEAITSVYWPIKLHSLNLHHLIAQEQGKLKNQQIV